LNHFNGLMAQNKRGKLNSYSAGYFVIKMAERGIDVSVTEIYTAMNQLQAEKMPTLVSGSQGYFLASSSLDLIKYRKRIKSSVKTLKTEIDRVDSVIKFWKTQMV